MKKVDIAITCAMLLAFVPLSIWGGLNRWGGETDLLPFIMIAIGFLYVVFEAVRLKSVLLVGVLGALIGASMILPSLIFYFEEVGVALAMVLAFAVLGAISALIASRKDQRGRQTAYQAPVARTQTRSIPSQRSGDRTIDARELRQAKEYRFTNPGYYSLKPLTELKGIVLLAPEGEAEQVAKSDVFIGTVTDTVGTWFDKIKQPKFAIGHSATRELFRRAQAQDETALQDIIRTGIDACSENTSNAFPPAPVDEHDYVVRAIPKNEVTGSCFLVLFVY